MNASAAPSDVVTTTTLKNGLVVVMQEDHSVPRVHISMRYGAGSAAEAPAKTGFAHLFEHLMFEGSLHVPEGAFDQWLEAAGGENNAYTSEDETYYFEEVPKNAVELALFLESDRLGYFVDRLGADLVDGQRDVVKNERRQSYENRPYGHAELLLPSQLWPKGHPYSWPVIGSMQDLSAASVDDVKAFFLSHYDPKNAVLTLVGDFQTKTVQAQVEHWFSDVPSRGQVDATAPALRTLAAERRVIVEDAQAPLPRVSLVWPTVQAFHPDDARLDVLAHVLGAGASSRLERRLVHELKIAQEVSVAQASMVRAGSFEIDVTAKPGVALPELVRAVDAVIAELKQTGPSAPELLRAQNAVRTGLADAKDSLQSKAAHLAHYQVALGHPDGFAEDLARYEGVTAADVQRVAARHLGAGRVVLSVVPVGGLAQAVRGPVAAAPPAASSVKGGAQ